MADVSQITTAHADGMHLCHFVGDGTEGRHRAKGYTLIVHIEACHDDTHPTVGQFIALAEESIGVERI